MYRLIETIKIHKNQIFNISYHNKRFNKTRKTLWSLPSDDLGKYIDTSSLNPDILYKCRIIYSKNIESIEYIPYTPKKINTLKIVTDDTINYSYKYEDRSKLQKLYQLRENADDILIIKNGLVTDSLFCNVLFFDGSKYLTPEKPLLEGTTRARLLEEGIIEKANIKEKDIYNFKQISLINAFYEPGEIVIDIRNIY